MRSLWIYYLAILVPFALLIFAVRLDLVSSDWFVVLLFSYFVFRQFTDAWRLLAIGAIHKVNWNTLANPLLQLKYFKQLYFVGK